MTHLSWRHGEGRSSDRGHKSGPESCKRRTCEPATPRQAVAGVHFPTMTIPLASGIKTPATASWITCGSGKLGCPGLEENRASRMHRRPGGSDETNDGPGPNSVRQPRYPTEEPDQIQWDLEDSIRLDYKARTVSNRQRSGPRSTCSRRHVASRAMPAALDLRVRAAPQPQAATTLTCPV
jgi:hypothetical protein